LRSNPTWGCALQGLYFPELENKIDLFDECSGDCQTEWKAFLAAMKKFDKFFDDHPGYEQAARQKR
jgi:hypothetical protein